MSNVIMSAGKCKRGPEVLLNTTSSSSSDDDSPRTATCSSVTDTPTSPPTTDHDYDVSSPSSSSTVSATSSTLQLPGVGEQLQQTPRRPRVKKKKADMPSTTGDILCTIETAHSDYNAGQMPSSRLSKHQLTPRSKPQRETVPMRMRALPQSMWQEPNVPHNVSPATVYPVLPPLITREGDDITALRPVTPPDEQDDREKSRDNKITAKTTSVAALPGCCNDSRRLHRPVPERTITVANPDLLMKLFDVVDTGRKMNPSVAGQLRRGRSKRVVVAGSHKSSFLCGQDPHMVHNITDTLFPQLSLERTAAVGGRAAALGSAATMVNLQPLTVGDKIIMLPSLNVDQNYPQMLSEVVAHI